MTKEQRFTLTEWLVQKELEAYRQAAKRSNNTKRTTYFEERSIAFEDASEYFADIRLKIPGLTTGDYITKDQAHKFKQYLKRAITWTDNACAGTNLDDAKRRIRYASRSEAFSEVLEFLNSGSNQWQE